MAQSENPSSDIAPAGAGLEYRSVDDAWYNVKVSLQDNWLTLNYSLLLGSAEEELYDARNFKSFDDVRRFRNRFRPLSAQVQDNECRKVVPGMTVCASYSSSEDDLRYFDAVVEQADHNSHYFEEGEEQCLCTFILFWLHGPGLGDLTTATVADICLLTDGDIDETLSEFIEMAKMMVMGTSMLSGVRFPTSISAVNCESQPSIVVHESGNEKEIICDQGQIIGKEDEGCSSSVFYPDVVGLDFPELSAASCEPHNQDTDLGGVDMILKKLVTGGYNYALVIDNLEKDLTPSTVMKFILKETTINSRVHIFPSLLTDMYTRGVIEVNSREEFIQLNDFLENTHQIVVSSHNRPWVITERLLQQGEMTVMSILGSQQIHSSRGHSELKVVRSGMPEYDMVKQCRENFTEFCSHGKLTVERLAFEEKKIRSRWIDNRILADF